MELNQFADCAGEVVGQLAVGHPVDLPFKLAQRSVATFVLLCLDAPAVPSDMVDFDGPPDRKIDAIRMNPDSCRETNRMLTNQWPDSATLQRSEHAKFQPRVGWTLPLRPGGHHSADQR